MHIIHPHIIVIIIQTPPASTVQNRNGRVEKINKSQPLCTAMCLLVAHTTSEFIMSQSYGILTEQPNQNRLTYLSLSLVFSLEHHIIIIICGSVVPMLTRLYSYYSCFYTLYYVVWQWHVGRHVHTYIYSIYISASRYMAMHYIIICNAYKCWWHIASTRRAFIRENCSHSWSRYDLHLNLVTVSGERSIASVFYTNTFVSETCADATLDFASWLCWLVLAGVGCDDGDHRTYPHRQNTYSNKWALIIPYVHHWPIVSCVSRSPIYMKQTKNKKKTTEAKHTTTI